MVHVKTIDLCIIVRRRSKRATTGTPLPIITKVVGDGFAVLFNLTHQPEKKILRHYASQHDKVFKVFNEEYFIMEPYINGALHNL